MLNRHSLPALAICATVAAVGLASSSASARGFGGQSFGGVGRTAYNFRPITHPALLSNGGHPAFLNPQPLPPVQNPGDYGRAHR